VLAPSFPRWCSSTAAEWFPELRIVGDSLQAFETFTLRAAVIPDNGGQRVEGVPATDPAAAGGAPGGGMSDREATDEVFKLLFLVARALVGASAALEPVRTRIHARYHTHAWWTSYWEVLRGRMQSAVADGLLPTRWNTSPVFGRLMSAALRETVDGEVWGLLQRMPGGPRSTPLNAPLRPVKSSAFLMPSIKMKKAPSETPTP